MLVTQLRAFEEVTTLVVEDPYMRGVFAEILSASYLVPKYKERELHLASVKAVISIKDNEVHEFFYRYSRVEYEDREEKQNLNQVRVYLRCANTFAPVRCNVMFTHCKVIRMFRFWLQDSCGSITLCIHLVPPGDVTSRLQLRLPHLSSVKFYTASLMIIVTILGFATILIAF